MEAVVILVALVVLNVAALRFGADSRDEFRPWGAAREHWSGHGGGEGSTGMWHPYEIEGHVRHRHAEALRWAAERRLLLEARSAPRPARDGGAPGPYRRTLHRLGGLLVAWGSRLQARVESPLARPSAATR